MIFRYRIHARRGLFYVYKNDDKQAGFRTFDEALKFANDCEAARLFNIQQIQEETK